MKCPKCERKLSKDNFTVIIYDHEEAEVVLNCECGNNAIIGFSEDDIA